MRSRAVNFGTSEVGGEDEEEGEEVPLVSAGEEEEEAGDGLEEGGRVEGGRRKI